MWVRALLEPVDQGVEERSKIEKVLGSEREDGWGLERRREVVERRRQRGKERRWFGLLAVQKERPQSKSIGCCRGKMQ